VTFNELAEIIQTEYNVFKHIPIELDEAYSFVLKTPNFARGSKEIVPLSLIPFKINFIQKILTLYLHPKASSMNDVS